MPPVTADAFDPARIGAKPGPKRLLRTLLVTGDSMSTPLDAEMARAARRRAGAGGPRSAPRHRHLEELPRRLGPAVGRPGTASTTPTRSSSSSAPTRASRMEGAGGRKVQCCGAEWAAAYANRVRRMVDTYRQQGKARVYWIGLPAAALTRPAADQPRRQRGGRGGHAAVARPGPGRRHQRDVHAERLPRRDGRGRRGDDRARSPTASTSTSGARSCWRTGCWSRSARTTCTSADHGLTARTSGSRVARQ